MRTTRALGAVAVVLAVFGLVTQDATPCVVVPSPMPIVRPRRPPQRRLETRSHQADIDIQGPVATVAVNAVFYNPNAYVLEGTYFFPLPANAAVDDFQMDINGKMVKGELLDAAKARGIYEGIVRKMKDPGLLEFVGTQLLKCRVYPMNPNSETKVKLTYSLAPKADGGLLEHMGQADVVNGIRIDRCDSWLRILSSRIANAVRNRVTGESVADVGCSLRVIRTRYLRRIKLFRGMHRFLPTLLAMEGARVIEVPVSHRPRRYGRSKYGIRNRLFVGIVDLLAVRWMKSRALRYRVRESQIR